MFEAVEVGNRLSKAEYEQQVPPLRAELISAQYALSKADFPVVILVLGNDIQGRNQIVNLLNEWLDIRHVRTYGFDRPSDEERNRPRFWRYWRTLPGNGETAIYVGAWALKVLSEHFDQQLDQAGFEEWLGHILRFEQALIDSGALLLKLWLHLPAPELKRRLRKASRQFEVDKQDWQWSEASSDNMAAVEHFLRRTSTGDAPWHLIEAGDERYRNLTVGRLLLEQLQERLARAVAQLPAGVKRDRRRHHEVSLGPEPATMTILDALDLSKNIARTTYQRKLPQLQAKLQRRTYKANRRDISSVLVFEGWDAAGKGGVIRRLTAPMDARYYRVVQIAAPTEEERAHHYLWRFWRHIPPAGHMVIFDRSWYGRVLVERVEGFAREDEWKRAYSEINDFEQQLVEDGVVLLKFWLHIDQDEQLRRFKEREQIPYKQYKITEEDYRNRERWEQYEAAVNEMVARTSTLQAPWHLVPANDKRSARLQVLQTVNQALKTALKVID